MHQRDYILRIIEQLGAVLAELRRRILGRASTPAEVDRALAETAGHVGFDLELLRGFTVETLRMLVSPTGEVEPARCWLMAEVLYLDGLAASLDDRDEEAEAAWWKARALYDLIRPAGGMIIGFPEAAERIAEIDARLAGDGFGDPEAPARRLRAPA